MTNFQALADNRVAHLWWCDGLNAARWRD